jgi:hypothetical protein
MRWEGTFSGVGVAALAMGMMGTALPVRVSAQQAQPGDAPSPAGATASIPHSTMRKAGAALRQIAVIQQDYTQRMKSAQTQNQRQALAQQAHSQAVQAINNQGLSVDQYNEVIREAQADPGTRQRLLAAAQRVP